MRAKNQVEVRTMRQPEMSPHQKKKKIDSYDDGVVDVVVGEGFQTKPRHICQPPMAARLLEKDG